MTGRMETVLIFSVLFGLCQTITLKSCNNAPGGNKVNVLLVDVNPDPVEIPGTFSIGATLEAEEDLVGVLSAKLTLTREVLWLFHVDLPCVQTEIHPDLKIGTCHYDNLCTVLDAVVNISSIDNSTQCPHYFADNISPSIPCHCPIAKGIYKLKPASITVKTLPLIYSMFVSGTYQVKLSVTNEDLGEEIACYEGELELGTAVYHNQTEILEQPVISGQDPIVG